MKPARVQMKPARMMMLPAAATAAASAAVATCWSSTAEMPPLPMDSMRRWVTWSGATPSTFMLRCRARACKATVKISAEKYW